MKINNYYDLEYFIERDRISLQTAHAVKIIAKKNKLAKILDVGCGTGKLIKFLNKNGFTTYGCDTAITAVNFTNKINRKKVATVASAEKLPYKNNAFDLLLSISTIEHLTKTQVNKFLKEARRVLKPNGFIFIVTPNLATPIRILQGKKWLGYKDPTHINFFTPLSLKSILKKNGFSNFKFLFKTNYRISYDWEFPAIFRNLPKPLKNLTIFLFFSSPLTFLRNSIWLSAKIKK